MGNKPTKEKDPNETTSTTNTPTKDEEKNNDKPKEKETKTNEPKNEKEENQNNIKITFAPGSLYQDIRQTYKFKEVLGGGQFGTVRICYKKDEEPRQYYAVKSISKKNLTEKDLSELIKEVEIISNLDHPNIIKFFETYHDQFYFHIVMELCKGKEVFDKIVQEDSLTEIKVAKIVYSLLSAINYCHTNGISHRDIKPENILFESQEADSDIKLIDFGLSRKYNSSEKMHTILGTPYYVAPEVLKGDYDQKCDLWSIGAITFTMLSGSPPFDGKTNTDIFKRILNDDLSFEKIKWKKISSEAKNFIKSCMHKNPDNRISSSEAFSHPWFNSINEENNTIKLDNEILTNIKNISKMNNFKKLVVKYMINFLSSKQIKKLKKVFNAIDKDHTGKIKKSELAKAFKDNNIEVNDEELKKIVSNSDLGGTGTIEYSDFIVASLDPKELMDEEKLITAFNYFDVDANGFIDSNDVKKALLRSGKDVKNGKDVEKMIDEVSPIPEDIKVSLNDFLKMFDTEEKK